MTDDPLKQAIALARSGMMNDARELIFKVLRNQPNNEIAWLWLAETLSTDTDRLKVLRECQRFVPDSQIIQQALLALEEQTTVKEDLIERSGVELPLRRTGFTGSLIGHDGSVILEEVPDFDNTVDLREPEPLTPEPPATAPVTEESDQMQTVPPSIDEPYDSLQSDGKFTRFANAEHHELEFEPDLSDLFEEEQPEKKESAFLDSDDFIFDDTPESEEPEEPFSSEEADLLASRLDLNLLEDTGKIERENETEAGEAPYIAELIAEHPLSDTQATKTEKKSKESLSPGELKRRREKRLTIILPIAIILCILATFAGGLYYVMYVNRSGSPASAPVIAVPTSAENAASQPALAAPTATVLPTQIPTPTAIPTAAPALQASQVPISPNAIKAQNAAAIQFKTRMDAAEPVFFSHDGKKMVSFNGKNILVWELASGKLLFTLRGHTDTVSDIVFSPDDKQLISAARDQTVKIWSLQTGVELQTLIPKADDIQAIFGDASAGYPRDLSVDIAPDGSVIAAGSYGLVTLWDVASGQVRGSYHLEEALLTKGNSEAAIPTGFKIRFSANSWSLGAVMPFQLVVLDALDARQIYAAGTGKWGLAAFSPDRMWMAERDTGGVVLHQLSNGEVVSGYDGRSDKKDGLPPEVRFDPRNLYLGIETGAVNESVGYAVWNLSSAQLIQQFSGPCPNAQCHLPELAFSPFDSLIAVEKSGADGNLMIEVWNLEKSAQLYQLAINGKSLGAITFSPDGKLLAAANEIGQIKIWDLESGAELNTLNANVVEQLSFSADGQFIRIHSGNYVQIWGLASSQ